MAPSQSPLTTPAPPPNAALRCDTSRFPIVVFTQTGMLKRPDIAYNLACYQEIFRRERRFVVIYDGRAGVRHDPTANKEYNDVFTHIRDDIARWCIGTAYVMDSILLRMALRGFLLIMRPPYPYAVFSTSAEAERWCTEQLASET